MNICAKVQLRKKLAKAYEPDEKVFTHLIIIILSLSCNVVSDFTFAMLFARAMQRSEIVKL